MRALLVLVLTVLFTIAAQADACFRRLCTGDLPIYLGRDGTLRDGTPYGVCQTDTSAPAAIAHSLTPCGPGTTLVPGAGLCHVDSCGSGGCTFRGICSTTPGFPTYAGDSRAADGTLTATCDSIPSGLNYRSHTPARCPAGSTLIPGTGVCRTCAGASVRRLPDLVFKEAWLEGPRGRITTVRRGAAYRVCFFVKNVGTANSGAFRVGAGGLGVPVAPHVDLPGLVVGDTRNACISYATTPPAGTYHLGLTVDSLSAVAELREDNNTTDVTVVVVP